VGFGDELDVDAVVWTSLGLHIAFWNANPEGYVQAYLQIFDRMDAGQRLLPWLCQVLSDHVLQMQNLLMLILYPDAACSIVAQRYIKFSFIPVIFDANFGLEKNFLPHFRRWKNLYHHL